MQSQGTKKWRWLPGVLAVGVLVFGLSPQRTPGGRHADGMTAAAGDVSVFSESARHEEAAGSAAMARVSAERKLVKAGRHAVVPNKLASGRHKANGPQPLVMARIKSVTDYAPIPVPAGRGGVQVGDPCSCDSDCDGLTSEGGCLLGQCLRATESGGAPNIDGTCQLLQQIPDTRCETDGDPCTVGRCAVDGTCIDYGGRSSPCAMECVPAPGGGGNDVGQNCCDEPMGCYGCTPPDSICWDKSRVTCVDNGGRANCRVDGSDVLFGRCCDPTNVLDGQYTTLADCDGGRIWLELTDPDDGMHVPVRCPGYSSGIVYGNMSNDANVVYPIVPPPNQCSMHSTEYNFGAVCEVDADCARRCAGDGSTACVTDADCDDAEVAGPCVADTCVPALDPMNCGATADQPCGGRCGGNYMIGDDYILDIPTGRALRLQEIRFRGGGRHQHEVLYFDFYDNTSWRCVGGNDHGSGCTAWGDAECDSGKCRPVRAGSYGLRVSQGGIFTYTIESDCDPNCDASQWCNPPKEQCECLPDNQSPGGCIADPPFIIPRSGFVVMRAGRSLAAPEGPDDLNGSWVPVDVTARAGIEMGTNDPDVMWVDDGPIGVSDAGPLAPGTRVLAFELVGREVDDHKGACCDPDTGSCGDTTAWNCRFCSGQGVEGQARRVCDRAGENWSAVDRDCPDPRDACTTSRWSGPRTKGDFDEPVCHGGGDDGNTCDDGSECDTGLCYGGERCGPPDNPCTGGACCGDDGSCAEVAGAGDCPASHCALKPDQSCTDDAGCVVSETDFGPCQPMFLGYGSACKPNCCPQAFDSGGVCCQDENRCTGGLNLRCDPNDPGACNGGADGSCVLMCPGPFVHQITVPPLVPEGQLAVVDITSDSRNAEPCLIEGCYDDGWVNAFHVDDCAVVTWTFCCTEPLLPLARPWLLERYPCGSWVDFHLPDPGHSGFGDTCGNEFCCTDGNYSAQWTLRAGTYHYAPVAGRRCEQSGNGCLAALDCAPGEACVDLRQIYQAHIYARPCQPAACCIGSTCEWVPEIECENAGGDWLGALVPNPIADCAAFGDPPVGPCSDGACCIAEGLCEDRNGTGMTPEECDAEPEGDYHGGVRCADRPCATCEFNMIGSQIDNVHCQGDTGQYIFPSDRFQGTRRADDFRPQDSPIRRVCFGFGYLTDEQEECTDDPPEDDFHIRFYEDAFGFPGTELDASPGPVVIDHKEPIPATRTWQFSAAVSAPRGVEVTPGECYWLEITGMGDDDCSTLWVHSVDGNNYGMRDDNDSYGPEDVRENDVVWCIDAGIVVPTEPGTNGGCGDIPVACCKRDATCEQMGFRACSDLGGYGSPYSTCGEFACPDPPNDVCDTDGDGTPDGAARICEGDPEHPEWGEWRYWSGNPGDQLGQCNDWPGAAGFGQICNPQLQDCREPSTTECLPHGYEWGYRPAYECYATTDNRLASTDGPVGGGACGSDNALQADVWYLITAPCCGRAVVTMCDAPSEYDAMLSVYGNDGADLECPGSNNEDLIECNDDYCRGSGTVGGVHWDARKGRPYLLRLGGYSDYGELPDAGQGISQFHIGFLCDTDCHMRQPPGLPRNTVHHARKHRYISIDATTSVPKSASIKVEIAEMNRCQNDLRRSCMDDDDCPTVCAADPDLHSCGDGSICPDGVCVESGPCGPHPNVGLSWYVQEPQTRGADCPNGMCDEEDWYARVDVAVYSSDWHGDCNDADWSGGCTTLHIGDCEIVPGVVYNVYTCDAITGDPCSNPLAVETTRRSELMPHYGDVAGAVTVQNPCCFTPPDGYTSVIDIAAYLHTNKNWGTTTLPQAHPTWLDLHGPGTGIPPQYILMVTDLTMILRAFVDIWPHENSIGGLAPGDCP